MREGENKTDPCADEYTAAHEPEDQLEWSLVLGEIRGFVEADTVVNVLDGDSNSIVLSHRLSPLVTPPLERSPIMTLSLQEVRTLTPTSPAQVIIVGNVADQVKFSELTLDMFRMLQSLEREPQDELAQVYDTSPAPGRTPMMTPGMDNGGVAGRRENPHKYLLYKPSLPQLQVRPFCSSTTSSQHIFHNCSLSHFLFMLSPLYPQVFLASGYRELPPQGALLLYISADGSFPVEPMPEDTGYDLGGVLMAPLREVEPDKKTGKQHCCLFPGDLFPYTRRPTFLILDSDNSLAFSSIPHYFDMPLVVLMSPQVRRPMSHRSPQDVPPTFQDHAHKGSLFTLFLHSPLSGSLP